MRQQTQAKLEYKLLYSLVVAGKNAKFAENVMKKFLDGSGTMTPFEFTKEVIAAAPGNLKLHLKNCRSGNYAKLAHAFKAVAFSGLNLKTCTPADLEKIKGIGPKTSRFFILWTRPNAEYAALDTHILKWLRYLDYAAPKTTPTGWRYSLLENVFLGEAHRRKVKPAKLDYRIWEHCRDNAKPGTDYNQDSFWPKDLRK